jgi:hypothetical protein
VEQVKEEFTQFNYQFGKLKENLPLGKNLA